MASEQNSQCRVFPLIKEVRAYVKQVEATGDHGKENYVLFHTAHEPDISWYLSGFVNNIFILYAELKQRFIQKA